MHLSLGSPQTHLVVIIHAGKVSPALVSSDLDKTLFNQTSKNYTKLQDHKLFHAVQEISRSEKPRPEVEVIGQLGHIDHVTGFCRCKDLEIPCTC